MANGVIPISGVVLFGLGHEGATGPERQPRRIVFDESEDPGARGERRAANARPRWEGWDEAEQERSARDDALLATSVSLALRARLSSGQVGGADLSAWARPGEYRAVRTAGER